MNVMKIACMFTYSTLLGLSGAFARTSSNVEFSSLTCISKQRDNDTCTPIQARAKLYVPAQQTKTMVIVSHGSQGLDERHTLYAKAINSMGMAALVIDHWGSRGGSNISMDYHRGWDKGLNSFNQALDALQAVHVFSDPARGGFSRFGLIGESQGGNAAIRADKLYTSQVYKRVFHHDAPHFDAIVGLFPGCFERYAGEFYLPIPFLIVSGEADNLTPATLCRRYADWMNSNGGRAQFIGLPNQQHDFDAPYYQRTYTSENASHCASFIRGHTRTWEETGETFPMTREGSASFWKKCFRVGSDHLVSGGNTGDKYTGYREWMAFFQAHLSK